MREFGSPLSGFGSPFLRRRGGLPPLTDADAAAYIAAVEAEDGQALEVGVRAAVDAFVIGCKDDGIWDAIKACCIMAGARTWTGSLTPLKGAAPTSYLFASTDYDRATGLKGDGVGKYLDSNRANNADPRNDQHVAAFVSTAPENKDVGYLFGAGHINLGATNLSWFEGDLFSRSRNRDAVSNMDNALDTGLVGVSRNSGTQYIRRKSNSTTVAAQASQAPSSENIFIFSDSVSTLRTTARLGFYSIGEALSLASLDARVSTLMTSIGEAVA